MTIVTLLHNDLSMFILYLLFIAVIPTIYCCCVGFRVRSYHVPHRIGIVKAIADQFLPFNRSPIHCSYQQLRHSAFYFPA